MVDAATVRIPEPHRTALLQFAGLPSSTVEEILIALGEVRPSAGAADRDDRVITRMDLVAAVRHALPQANEELAGQLIDAVLSLHVFRTNQGWSDQEVAEASRESPDLPVDAQGVGQLAQNLSRLLGVPAIAMVAKAFDVIGDYEQVYQRARILTDARPVFGDDPRQPPIGMVIVQTLKLDYALQNGQIDSFYVAMDNSKLHDLKRVVDRALEKIVSLTATLDRSGIPHVEPEASHGTPGHVGSAEEAGG